MAAPTRPAPTSLADLEPGAGARVVEVDGGSPIARRLLDLGFVPGTEVRVVRRAPLGDPVEYELRGYRLCLRRSEALRIRVEPACASEARSGPELLRSSAEASEGPDARLLAGRPPA